MDERVIFIFLVYFTGLSSTAAPRTCPYLSQTIYGDANASFTIGGMFSVHQQHRDSRDGSLVVCSLHENSEGKPLLHRFGVEQTEAMALAIDQINSDSTLLNGTTLRFALRDTCGLLGVANCPEDLARSLADDDDVTATIVGSFYSRRFLEKQEVVERVADVIKQLSLIPSQSPEGRGVFPLLDMPELRDASTVGFTETVRYVSHSCVLQARAAVDFLVNSGWQDIVLITSADNCGTNIFKEFQDVIRKRNCNFKVQYYEETPINGVATDTYGNGYTKPRKVSRFQPYTLFQGLSNDTQIIVVLSSISFAYELFQNGYYHSSYAEQRGEFVFLLGEFWGDPGKADDLYEVITKMVGDSLQVVSLRTHVSGYEKFKQHMASLTSSSRELQRNFYLQQYWSEQFNCEFGVNCSDSLRLSDNSRHILRNTDAILVIDAVYAATGYIQQDINKFPNNERVVFSESKLRELNVTSWTGNVLQLDKYVGSYIQVVEWKYDFLILKSAGERNGSGHLDAVLYGQWTMHKDELDNLTVYDNAGIQLWTPQPIAGFEICMTNSTPVPPIAYGDGQEVCSPSDLRALVALPVIVLSLLVVMGFLHGMAAGWISTWESMSKLGNIILFGVTTAAILVSVLISVDVISAFSCDLLVADFLVNTIGCVSYAVILVAVLASGFGGKLNHLQVKCFMFSLIVIPQIILLSFASFVTVNGQGSNETYIYHCMDARDHSLVYVSYSYNAIIALFSALTFLVSSRRVKTQSHTSPSCAATALGLFLAVIFVSLVGVFLWTGKCLLQMQLLVVLAVYPAFVSLCMVSKSSFSLWHRIIAKRGTDDHTMDDSGMKPSFTVQYLCVVSLLYLW